MNRTGGDRKMGAQGWLCLLCGTFLALASWDIGYADWRDVPTVKGVCVRGCDSPPPPSRIYKDMPSERPIKEPVYGPSPAEVKEGQARVERANRVKQELKNNILRLTSPVSVVMPVSSVVVQPGTSFFNIQAGTETILAAPLAGVKTPGSKVPIENLQRAAAILASLTSAMGNMTDEDASFLAGQAAFAMDGAPLQVLVAIPVTLRPEDKEQARQLAQLTEGIQKESRELEASLAARTEVEKRLKQKKDADYTEYRQAIEREQKARANIAEKESQLNTVFRFKIIKNPDKK